MSDIVRVLRLVEYVGPREWVEKTVQQSLHGTRTLEEPGTGSSGARITAITLTEYPEVLDTTEALREDERRIAGFATQALLSHRRVYIRDAAMKSGGDHDRDR